MHPHKMRQWSARSCPLITYHHPRTRALSVIGSPLHSYGKALFKKFLFQTHPDFFVSQQAQQSINSANLRYLQSIIDEPRSDQSINIRKTTRTLTFYLKADESLNEPRKVRVSLHRLLPSISEILETVGAALPPKPPGYTEDSAQRYYNSDDGTGDRSVQSNVHGTRYEQYEKTWLTTEARQAIDFLESLQDRRELLKIKHELYMNYKAIETEVVQLTGLNGVEYRNSWSMQNNALLLQQLLRQLRAQPDRFALPWTGMKLVFAIDHGYVGNDGRATVAIDYLEGTILIDCLEVSATWIDKLRQVKQDEIQRAIPMRQEIELMRERCASYAQYLVKRQLFIDATAATAGAAAKQQQSLSEQHRQGTNDQQYRVTISRGHTCSLRQFGSALYSFLSQAAGPVDPFLDHSSQESAGTSSSSTNTSTNNTIQFHSAPLPLSVSIEVSHGIKVLTDGTLRLDAELLDFLSKSSHQTQTPQSLQSQWEQKFGVHFLPQLLSTWIKTSKEQQRRQEEIRALEDHLQCALSLTGIRMGLGITQEMYIRFLRIVTRYLDFKNGLMYIEGNFDSFHRHEGGYGEHQAVRYGGKQQFNRVDFEEFYYPYYQPTDNVSAPHDAQKEKQDMCRIRNCGVLKHLNGFTVSVGHYSGIMEDGSCVLPWDFPLQQLIMVQTYESR